MFYKNANKSQRSSAFLRSNKELNKEKMLILKLLYFCLALLLIAASITFWFPLLKLKIIRGTFFFILPEVPLFYVRKLTKQQQKLSSRRKPGFLVSQGLALLWALPTRSAALGGAEEVASCGEGAVTLTSPVLGSVCDSSGCRPSPPKGAGDTSCWRVSSEAPGGSGPEQRC